MQSDFQDFSILREKMYDLTRLKNREEQLLTEINDLEKAILKLQVNLDMENEDVERLTKRSLSNLFYTILRSKSEQLEKERKEVLEVTLHLQEAKMILDDHKDELTTIRDSIAELSTIPQKYDELLFRKEILLKSMPASAHKLEEMEVEISNHTILHKELKEALNEGKGVHSHLTKALESLEKAEDWGNWDLWLNGGIISTHLKHEHIDDARSHIHSANSQMNRFQKELADIKKSVDIDIDIGELLTLADYFIGGLIIDWIVQDKIENSLNRIQDALYKIRPIITQLGQEANSVEQKIKLLTQERINWIEKYN